jgi:hypothetical protein
MSTDETSEEFEDVIKRASEEITQIVSKNPDLNYELEFRLGYLEPNRFNANISDMFFNKIKSTLSSSSVFKKTNNSYTDTIKNVKILGKNSKVRHSTLDNKYIVKDRLMCIDVTCANSPFDFRICLSTEKVINEKAEKINGQFGHPVDKSIDNVIDNNSDEDSDNESDDDEGFQRHKERSSFLYKHWSWDLTIVSSGSSNSNRNKLSASDYEVELEVIDIGNKMTDLEYILESSLMKIKDLIKMCEKADNVTYVIQNVKVY